MAKAAKQKTENADVELIEAFIEKALGHGLVATEEEKDAIEAAWASIKEGKGE